MEDDGLGRGRQVVVSMEEFVDIGTEIEELGSGGSLAYGEDMAWREIYTLYGLAEEREIIGEEQ